MQERRLALAPNKLNLAGLRIRILKSRGVDRNSLVEQLLERLLSYYTPIPRQEVKRTSKISLPEWVMANEAVGVCMLMIGGAKDMVAGRGMVVMLTLIIQKALH